MQQKILDRITKISGVTGLAEILGSRISGSGNRKERFLISGLGLELLFKIIQTTALNR